MLQEMLQEHPDSYQQVQGQFHPAGHQATELLNIEPLLHGQLKSHSLCFFFQSFFFFFYVSLLYIYIILCYVRYHYWYCYLFIYSDHKQNLRRRQAQEFHYG